MLQSKSEIEEWHKAADPWGYESNPDDARRKLILLSELPVRKYDSVLDIGCGQGFVTRDLPGKSILGVDVSEEAIQFANRYATERINFRAGDLFHLDLVLDRSSFDLVLITGVLYPQYIGDAHTLIYEIVDRLLADNGVLVSVHVNEWYKARFPYLVLKEHSYGYRQYHHRLEVYTK